MTEDTKPKPRKDIIAKKLGSEMMLYDPKSDDVHVLNETSLFIWNSLDGNQTYEAIESIIRKNFEVPDDQNVLEDITNICRDFRAKGLLE